MNDTTITLTLTDKEAATLLDLIEDSDFQFGGDTAEYGTRDDHLQSIHDKLTEAI